MHFIIIILLLLGGAHPTISLHFVFRIKAPLSFPISSSFCKPIAHCFIHSLMALKINASLLLFLLLLIPLISSGMVEGFKDGMNPKYSLHKDDGGRVNIARKLLVDENALVLDYDDAGANTRHDPPKKKPGGGGKP
ncbi:hypothetical protein Pint_05088 [Pistacia integerrima]|uniref:Uncharacterized protein n=1 Tax=Pistacia integerrima TaxID=434235 RepID=A0ACC0Z421_9ROSI|nr:hypothetical protein Pint_05088 [Pistacia integerrima]